MVSCKVHDSHQLGKKKKTTRSKHSHLVCLRGHRGAQNAHLQDFPWHLKLRLESCSFPETLQGNPAISQATSRWYQSKACRETWPHVTGTLPHDNCRVTAPPEPFAPRKGNIHFVFYSKGQGEVFWCPTPESSCLEGTPAFP